MPAPSSATADRISAGAGYVSVGSAEADIDAVGATIEAVRDATIALNGDSDLRVVDHGCGTTLVSGYEMSDAIQLPSGDIADWQALQGAMTQSGADTLIGLDGADTLRLTNIDASTLTAAQFRFA